MNISEQYSDIYMDSTICNHVNYMMEKKHTQNFTCGKHLWKRLSYWHTC